MLRDDVCVDEPYDDVLRATPMDLVVNFRNALLAVLPAAEAAHLSWLDDNQHYEWERPATTTCDVLSVDR